MKKKNILIITIIILFIISLVFYSKLSKNDRNIIKRINLNLNQAKDSNESYSTPEKENITIKTNKNIITIIKDKKAYTFSGIKLDKGKEIVKRVKKGGVFIVNFFFFQKKTKQGEAILILCQKREEKTIKKVNLNEYNSIIPFSFTLNLKKNDLILIRNNGSESALISNLILSKKKNEPSYVFLIGVDTLRRDSVGIYGGKHKATPNIDKFSKDSIIFENAFAPSPWTLPSFSSVYTGVYPDIHLCNYSGDSLPADIPTLFEKLNDKFLTIGFTGDYFLHRKHGFERGFDLYQETNNDGVKRDAAKDLFLRTKNSIKNLDKEQNILFFLHTYQIHNPYFPEIELAKRYYKDIIKKDYNLNYMNIIKFINGGKELCKKVNNEEKDKIIALYNAGVYTFDYRFGEFIKFLKKIGIYKKSTIILFADHGEEFEDHGCWEHGQSLYNELIKIPLIVKLPDNKDAGKKIKENVSLIDIYPTLIKLFKIKKPEQLQGKNLLNPIPNRIIESYLYPDSIRNNVGRIALIKGNKKLIYSKELSEKQKKYFIYPPKYKKLELYNIYTDPQEKHNILIYRDSLVQKFLKILRTKKFKRRKKGDYKDIKKRLKTIGYL